MAETGKPTTVEKLMEGFGQSHNPLKKAKPDPVEEDRKSRDDGQKPPKQQVEQGSEKADDNIQKEGKLSENDNTDHSYANGSDANSILQDLMTELRLVNEMVQDIKVTVTDSLTASRTCPKFLIE